MADIEILRQAAVRNRGVLTRPEILKLGLSDYRTRQLVQHGSIARLSRGVYAIGEVDVGDPRSVTARHKLVLSLDSAAAWYGVDLPRPVTQLHGTASRNRGRRKDAIPGVRLHRADLGPDDVLLVRGALVTSPLCTATQLARRWRLEDAVAVVDAFMRASLFSLAEFQAAAEASQGPGRSRLMLVASLIDPMSGSILESLTRVLLWRNRLCPPTSQYLFKQAKTGWVGYIDFAWPELKLLLECDGYEWHSAREPFQKDRRRWSAVTRARWRLIVVTWFDVVCDPDYVVALVRDLLDPDPTTQQHTLETLEAPAPAA